MTEPTISTIVVRVEELIRRAEAIDQGSASESSQALAARLRRTVLRPLADLGDTVDRTTYLESETADAQWLVFELAMDLTRACATDQRAALLEACAGAHYLVSIGPDDARQRITRLAEMSRDVPGDSTGRVRVRENGPYLLTGVATMSNFLGEPTIRPPVAALCRCGRSESKPWCDGTHATIGFDDRKHPDRVADRLDAYAARQFTILDNRGICAHSGRCTDALPAAFRVGAEPFVAPAGARADDILRAIQSCPSGALGAAIAERRAADLVDRIRPPAIEVSKDGPYFVTGGVDLRDDAGSEPVRAAGSSREHFALCRCGQSKNKPFCSGAHWYADFHDPVIDPGHEPTLFEWAGGYPVLLRVTRLFYERHVPQDDLLAPLFSRMEPDHPERVASWLSEVFGGPKFYSQRYGGYSRMISQHLNKHLTEAQRARWVSLLCRSADEALLAADPEFRAAFVAYLEWGTRIAVENSQDDSRPPEGMPVPRWWWVCDATPSARPPSRPTARGPIADLASPETAAPGEALSFERHIKGLFRARDRGAMRFAFDLWSVAEVRTHADAIQARLKAGTMPCDGAWPADRISLFERWIAEGCAD
ncbi:MAG TPA: CDGSH iron-sulfur domain-containing protein [Vicinamibacterales bacterium]|nr:CDGSH iron-sulfur domain-containing protein [Vicinamibacterales bacterium]